MSRLLIRLHGVAAGEDYKAEKARSLLNYYFRHGQLSVKQRVFASRLIGSSPKPKKTEKKTDYFLYAIDDGLNVKLGYSANPGKRLKDLQTGAASTLKVVWKYKVGDARPIAAKAEKKLHRLCSKHRKRGEWFDRDCMELVKGFRLSKG